MKATIPSRILLPILGTAVALFAAAPALAEPASISAKRAEAQRVLAQISGLDASLSHAIESYNAANWKLQGIQADLRENRRELGIAKTNLRRAQAQLAQRLVILYTNGGGNGTLDVLLGASSLEDLLDGIDTADRVSNQDGDVLKAVRTYRTDVQARRVRLRRAKAEQARLVAERAAEKQSIESRLAERRRLVSSIQGEIQRLQSAERARQAQLERAARVRLAAAPAPSLVTTPDPAEASSPLLAAPPSRHGGVVGIAMRYLGIPYVYGGSSPSGFDCSGFVMYVYGQIGVSLPHNAAAQYAYGTPVSRDQLQPGDLVFFNGLGHNGIYIGGGQFIHSPHTGDVVKISSLSGWYSSTWVGAKRL